MAIDAKTEHLLTFAQLASKVPPNGTHVCTVYRWADKGCRGQKLETLMVGGRRYSTFEALLRFSDKITASVNKPKSLTSKEREAAIRAAEDRLESLGI